MPPVIDPKLCTACGKCWEICEGDVFYGSKKGEQPRITYPDECWHDGNCVVECPVRGAIKLRVPLPMMISYK
jgi:NAD-dependent dihydropyrimidine dehydrogenase PreA subunit